MRRAAPALRLLAAPTAGLAAALAIAPGQAPVALHVYLAVSSALVLGWLVVLLARTLRAPQEAPFASALVRSSPAASAPVQQLERVEREVTLARQNAWDCHRRLRATLRAVAGGLLAERRMVDLDRDAERAAAELGPEAWGLLRPDRPPPADRHAAGIGRDELDRVLASLERLAWS
ncbi:MAG TPA: hypothetical protein VFB26_11035 [Gaiellaceae bacterium]|nr:hypothetical protein [Gaiellaceae bacterium]